MRVRVVRAVMLAGLVLVLALLSGEAYAQSTIAGLATDTSGAVLPGVTVEVSSPALIERTRSAVTNSDGRYTIVDLRPGVYVVTFTLTGFSSIKREGIQIAANVTVPLNAELQVGSVAETITVSGSSPVVDVQQAASRAVLSRDVLDALPTTRTFLDAGAIAPSVKLTAPDVGGTALGQAAYLSARGKSSQDDSVEIDGIDVRISNGVTQSGYNNFAMVQDVSYQTSAIAADSPGGGVRISMIPREGGNAVSGDFYLGGTKDSFQSNNITAELQHPANGAPGLPSAEGLKSQLEVTPSVGFPVMKDKMWLFLSGRYFDLNSHPAGAHYFATGAPGYTDQKLNNLSGRFTYQVNQKNKVAVFLDKLFKKQDHTAVFTLGANITPNVDWGTATSNNNPSNTQVGYAKWTLTATNKLLFETGFGENIYNTGYNNGLPGQLQARNSAAWFASAPRNDLLLGTLYGGCCASTIFALQPTYAFSTSGTYVTGSHTLKAGVQYRFIKYVTTGAGFNGDLIQEYRNNVPSSVTAEPTPYVAGQHAWEVGPYVTDTWAIHRLTVTAGVRFDAMQGTIEGETLGPGRFVPARNTVDTTPLNSFKNWSPRLGAVYDLFGNAKTALKVSVNKYLTQLNGITYLPYNPISSSGDRRTWLDCDLLPGTSTCSGAVLPTNGDNIAQDNEIGPSNNPLFGTAVAATPASNLSREYSWDYTASVQHEVVPGVSAMFGWYFTRSYNNWATLNKAVTFDSYTPIQVVNPVSNQQMTVFNLNSAFQGKTQNFVQNSDINHRDYNAYEASVQARIGHGGTVLGGWAMERTRTVSCDTTNPNALIYCDQTGALHQDLGAVSIPYRHEFKLAASYPLPWAIQPGVSFLSYPGLPLTVTYLVPTAALINKSSQPSVPLIAPGTSYLDRWSQLDFHITREIKTGKVAFRPTLEVFNLLNSSVVLNQQQTFGPSLGQPLQTIQGRLTKFSVLVKF